MRPKEGSVFKVQLEDGLGEVYGVVARSTRTGLLVYVFADGARRNFRPDQAIYIGMVGVQGFKDGSWHLQAPLTQFSPAEWPVPRFVRGMDEGYPRIITYDDDLHELAEDRPAGEDLSALPRDRLSGSVAAVYHFGEALRTWQQRHRPAA